MRILLFLATNMAVLARVIGHTVDRVVFKTERGYGISEQLKQGFSGLFRSHPPLDDRIRALQQG